MKIIRPLAITAAMITSTNASADTAAAWVATTPYALDALVQRPLLHKVYRRTAAGTTATPPENDAANWQYYRETNPWAMFGTRMQAQTTAPTALSVTITPTTRVDGLYLANLSGSKVRVVCGTYDREVKLARRTVTGWYSYLFEPFSFRKEAVFLGIPPLRQPITITVTAQPGELAGLGPTVVGSVFNMGGSMYGAGPGFKDFSEFTEAFDGSLDIVPRDYVKTLRISVLIKGDPIAVAAKVDEVHRQMTAWRGKPVVWIGSDDLYECLTVYGIYRGFDPSINGKTETVCQLQIRGLT